jgi:hypothetical protein
MLKKKLLTLDSQNWMASTVGTTLARRMFYGC